MKRPNCGKIKPDSGNLNITIVHTLWTIFFFPVGNYWLGQKMILEIILEKEESK